MVFLLTEGILSPMRESPSLLFHTKKSQRAKMTTPQEPSPSNDQDHKVDAPASDAPSTEEFAMSDTLKQSMTSEAALQLQHLKESGKEFNDLLDKLLAGQLDVLASANAALDKLEQAFAKFKLLFSNTEEQKALVQS